MGWSVDVARAVRGTAAVLASVFVAVPVLPASTATSPGPDTVTLASAPATPGCDDEKAAVVTALPWAQQRYSPDRLASLATGAGVTVAVIDSGVDARHPQLRRRVVGGADYLDPRGDGTVDCAGHGTAVASIIAAEPRSGVGFRGLAPQARILPVRVSEQQVIEGRESGRTVTATQFGRAVRWAVDHNAGVLNLSVVMYVDSPAVRSAVAYAVEHDVVVVAAVGNLHDDGDPTPYPAAYPGVLGVGSIGPDGIRSPFSQIGSWVDVVAPGGDVLTAAPGGGHRKRNGTSYAVPFVAATAALVRDYRPDLSAPEVIERIVATTDPAPGGRRSEAYGNGAVNPYRAVTETSAGGPPPPASVPPTAQRDLAAASNGRRALARQTALWLAASAGAGAVVVIAVATVVPRGFRRRWRPAEPT